jgi:predicted alpha/beta-hydrolase family hydrolase
VPDRASGDGLVLTHGAGSNCSTPLLTTIASAFAGAGVTVLRCDLPFRQARPHGPPTRGSGPTDRAGLQCAVAALRPHTRGHLVLGGHSYGGRQASILAAEVPDIAEALLLLAYPLHPPHRPSPLRTAHLPSLRMPVLFVHGSRDPFATSEELDAARSLIPAPTALVEIAGAAHDLASLVAADLVRAVMRLVDGC